MKNVLLLIFGLGLLTFLVSCESEDAEDVNQQRIETNYYLTYDEGSEETVARAEFTFGSTYLRLNAPSEVLFENDKLRETEILGIVGYSRTYKGVMNSGTFTYINQEEIRYNNTVVMADAIGLPDDPLIISVSEGATIAWLGRPVRQGETVSLSLSTTSGTYSYAVDAVNATKIVIGRDQLPAPAIGEAEIIIERSRKNLLAEAPEEGGHAYSTYTSLKMAAEVVE